MFSVFLVAKTKTRLHDLRFHFVVEPCRNHVLERAAASSEGRADALKDLLSRHCANHGVQHA